MPKRPLVLSVFLKIRIDTIVKNKYNIQILQNGLIISAMYIDKSDKEERKYLIAN